MAHYSESASETTKQVVQDHSKSTGPTTKEVVQQHLEDYLGERLERQDELLGGVLQRLDEVLSKQSGHDHELLEDNPDDDQPVAHIHGDDCPQCVHEQLKGVQRSAVWHDKNVPGAKEAREHAITGEKMVTIVDDRPATANTEDLTDTQFKLFAAGVMKEVGERGIR